MQFHPLAYIVKLKIELSMAELIAKIAKHRDPHSSGRQQDIYAKSKSRSGGGGSRNAATVLSDTEQNDGQGKAWAKVTTTLEMKTMDASGREVKSSGADGSKDSDTDSLIDPASIFAVTPDTISPANGMSRDFSVRGAGGSMSSYNTYNEGTSGVKQDT
jgi:hypothetical protein